MTLSSGAALELWPALLLVTVAVHAGFQSTVTLLVYPALAEVPAAGWPAAHDRHSRRITPLVAVVYGAVLTAGLGTLLTSERTTGVWATVLATGAAFLVTALGAAPLHGRLGRGHDPTLLTWLLRVDRLRLGFALLALLAAVVLGVLPPTAP